MPEWTYSSEFQKDTKDSRGSSRYNGQRALEARATVPADGPEVLAKLREY